MRSCPKKKSSKNGKQAPWTELTDRDKLIAKRCDRMSGSKYLLVIATQFIDQLVHEEELNDMSEENRMAIRKIVSGYQ